MAGYTVTGEKCLETSFSLYLFKQLCQVCVLVLDACAGRDVNGTDISRPYLNSIRSGRVFIRQYPILKIFIIHIRILKVVFL